MNAILNTILLRGRYLDDNNWDEWFATCDPSYEYTVRTVYNDGDIMKITLDELKERGKMNDSPNEVYQEPMVTRLYSPCELDKYRYYVTFSMHMDWPSGMSPITYYGHKNVEMRQWKDGFKVWNETVYYNASVFQNPLSTIV